MICFYLADCHESCQTCSGPDSSSCISCSPSMRKDVTGHCEFYSKCSVSMFMGEDEKCEPCHVNCLTCSGANEHHCLSCHPAHHLHSESILFCRLVRFVRKSGLGQHGSLVGSTTKRSWIKSQGLAVWVLSVWSLYVLSVSILYPP